MRTFQLPMRVTHLLLTLSALAMHTGCAARSTDVTVPGPPMLAGGHVVDLPAGCALRPEPTGSGAIVITTAAELAAHASCRDDAATKPHLPDPSGHVWVLFTASKEGGPPFFTGIERHGDEVVGVFGGESYCGGAAPPTSFASALVELDARPAKVRAEVRETSVRDCPPDLP